MSTVAIDETATDLAKLLSLTAQGDSVVITRRGRAIARLDPVDEMRSQKRARPADVSAAVARFRALRERTRPVTQDELQSWIREGRRS
jgi:antitoxin (DNA-binding transcriptional repressor) of toxin-antitoxin stability system